MELLLENLKENDGTTLNGQIYTLSIKILENLSGEQ